VRALIVVVLLLLLAPTVNAYVSSAYASGSNDAAIESKTVEPRDGITVITTDAFGSGRLIAFAPNGSVLHYEDEYPYYHDVDPVNGTSATVEFVASENVNKSACNAEMPCRVSFYERLNLTTGERERVWSRVQPRRGSNAIHDVDRLDENHLLVADISNPDRVYKVDTRTGIIEWSWSIQQSYDVSSGGKYPGDWTHVNDVEKLDNGLVMASLRNQDSAVFVDPETGVVENMTLGSDDDHDTLFEQHNPDYIPEERGGPAVLVADSENSRVIEYQREGDSWNQSWVWKDGTMQWPRDADRLPNGNTLIADTNADRVVEVAPDGSVVWEVSFPGPYDVERLSTPDESGGGQSAAAAGLTSRSPGGGSVAADDGGDKGGMSVSGYAQSLVAAVVPSYLVNSALYLLPAWMTALTTLTLIAFVGLLVAWAGLELRWSRYEFQPRRVVSRQSR
jgi:hypothetical protein